MAAGTRLRLLVVLGTSWWLIPATGDASTACDVTTWDDVKSNCGSCRALVKHMSNDGPYGGMCSTYCAAQGLQCLGQQEENDDSDCDAEWTGLCYSPGKQNGQSTSDLICQCAPATCQDFVCPTGTRLRPGAGSLMCRLGAGCNLRDEDTCCLGVPLADKMLTPMASAKHPTCMGYTCPTGSTLRQHPENIMCKSSQFCENEDQAVCCEVSATSHLPRTTTLPLSSKPVLDGMIFPKATTSISPSTTKATSTSPPDATHTTPEKKHHNFQLSNKEKVIGGAVLGGGVLLGGAVGALTGSIMRQQVQSARQACSGELKSDHLPGSSILDMGGQGCFRVGDSIKVGSNSLRFVEHCGGSTLCASIFVDKPIMSYVQKGTLVEKQLGTPVEKQLASTPLTPVEKQMGMPIETQPASLTMLHRGKESLGAKQLGALQSQVVSTTQFYGELPSQGPLPGYFGHKEFWIIFAATAFLLCLLTVLITFCKSRKGPGQGKRGYGKVAAKGIAISDSRQVRFHNSDQLVDESPDYEVPQSSGSGLSQTLDTSGNSYASSYWSGYHSPSFLHPASSPSVMDSSYQPSEVASSVYDQSLDHVGTAKMYPQSTWFSQDLFAPKSPALFQPDGQGMMQGGQNVPMPAAMAGVPERGSWYNQPQAQWQVPQYGEQKLWGY